MKAITVERITGIAENYILPEGNTAWFIGKITESAISELGNEATDDDLDAYVDEYLNS